MKLNANATFIKIPLAQIRETGNVRHKYDEDGIRELAESIRNNGLMNPITVKPAQEDENGEKTYELIAGHRRIRAYKYLCDQGDDFSMVECCIRTGNKLVLQIIENIQRADITPREKEDAIAEMLAENYTQTDIASELSKPIQWVSDIVAGAKVRKVADYHGFDTENIATKTLSQLRTIPEDELYAPLEQLVMRGGTMKAATDILHEWKAAQDSSHSELDSESTTNESSIDVDEYIDGMFKDEADDIVYSEDENMIEPHEITEAEWEDDNLPNGLKIGDYVQGLGKRLHYSDLSVGSVFIKNVSTVSRKLYQLCKVLDFNDFEQFSYDDDNYQPSLEHPSSDKESVDGDDPYEWIYEVTERTTLAPDKPLEGNDEWDEENECFLAPAEMTEAEWNYREEREKKEGRFITGTEINKIGKRLFFKDLWIGRNFAMPFPFGRPQEQNGKFIVAQVTSFNGAHTQFDCYWRTDERDSKGHNMSGKTTIEDFLIDSEVDVNSHWWIYEIPDDAVAVKVPDMQPVKTEPTVMSEADFNTSELADEASKPTTHKSSKNSLTVEESIQNDEIRDSMILARISSELRKLSLDKIGIKNYGKIEPISGFELRVAENKIVFLSQNPDSKTI